MAYVSRDIKDRIAIGDDCFYIEQLSDGRVRLIPAPSGVSEAGTPVNKQLLQPIEDRVVWLMNHIFNDITSNPFSVSFETLDGVSVQSGIWNTALSRIEC